MSGAKGPRGIAAVLGGTRGLGRELAREAMRHDCGVVVYGRSAAPAEAPAAEVPEAETLAAEVTAAAVPAARAQPLRARALDLTDPAAVDAVDLAELRGPGPLYLFWVAGEFRKQPLAETAAEDADRLTALLWQGPVRLLRRLLADRLRQPSPPQPLHLVTVASASSWRAREEQSLYCGLKAAQAAFTRALTPELLRADPRNRVTLIQPGAMATPGFHDVLGLTPEELDAFMDPAVVAAHIWQLVNRPEHPARRFLEAHLLRGPADPVTGHAVPRLLLGPQAPEAPPPPDRPHRSGRPLPEAARL
ncbi:SDR family oxidoreductase [Streptomyces sp. WP-1]|uniref:SDR family NAD(P)-dependent oxidoreductase n=1 Tax=Streptomyces sp. WP-1 TaxID=3041497 RepID=UPI002647886D|nr:SDR family oxidoreductase [Streptomyces sp. WP-1]WKE68285.1 SDR family oxidoreductase [Streptomyces sp. WP-1]